MRRSEPRGRGAAAGAEAEVLRRIRERGRITFEEFGRLALYHPSDGYYTQSPASDYFTSPAVHPAFGALLSGLAHRTWGMLGRPARFHVVELGSGDSRLAQDFTSYASELCPRFSRALVYIAVDRASYGLSEGRFESVLSSDVPLRNVTGLVLSNELVDALPVHRFEVRDGIAQEVYVTLEGGELVDVLGEPSTPAIGERLATLGRALPEGYRGEVNLAIRPLMRRLAGVLDRGFVLTIDYGHEAQELYAPDRAAGTLRTYRGHTFGADPYRYVGRQDVTAHVDFTALMTDGRAAGLRSLGLVSQREALTALGIGDLLRRLSRTDLRPSEHAKNRVALEELVRTDGLGGFKWLLQGKDVDSPGIGELLRGRLGCCGCVPSPPVPLIGGGRVRLGEGRYPGGVTELRELWPPGE